MGRPASSARRVCGRRPTAESTASASMTEPSSRSARIPDPAVLMETTLRPRCQTTPFSSNAADACDKLRFESIANPDLLAGDAELRIDVSWDKDARTITIRDTGIGMSRDEVVANIGSIASSGTRRFLEAMGSEQKADARLIGQFGVGFYSAFVVADRVTLVCRPQTAQLINAEGTT